MSMVSLREHNAFRMTLWNNTDKSKKQPIGIACNHCGAELLDFRPDMRPIFWPPKIFVVCDDCGFEGYAYE